MKVSQAATISQSKVVDYAAQKKGNSYTIQLILPVR